MAVTKERHPPGAVSALDLHLTNEEVTALEEPYTCSAGQPGSERSRGPRLVHVGDPSHRLDMAARLKGGDDSETLVGGPIEGGDRLGGGPAGEEGERVVAGRAGFWEVGDQARAAGGFEWQ